MNLVAPMGPVYQAGTLSGNPLAMTAGIATLNEVGKQGFYRKLEKSSANLERGLIEAAKEAECPVRLNRVGSMLGIFFTEHEVIDYSTAKSSDTQSYPIFFHAMLDRGVYLPPSPFETIFVSAAHSMGDISLTIEAAKLAFHKVHTKREVSSGK